MGNDLISREALERIIKRAAELQAGERDIGEGLTSNEVLSLGKDVGIPDRYLRQAMLEEQTRITPEVATGTWAWLTGPRSIIAHRVVPGDRSRTRQPRPRARRYFRRDPRLLFQHGLAEITVRNPDILAEREDFVAGEPFADVAFSGLQLRGALDDALERFTADEVVPHQTFVFPLLRSAGRRSPAVWAGRARLPESATFSMNPSNKSIGIGKIVVELFSDAISLTVCRK